MWGIHKGQWRGALMFSLICACINAWINSREAGDLRHHRAHYDVILMTQTRRYPLVLINTVHLQKVGQQQKVGEGGSRLIHFLQLRRFLRSLDGSTNTGGSPKCFTLPHALWPCYLTKHQRMAQIGTWWQFSILDGWNGRRRYNIDMTCGFESEIYWCIEFV